MLKPITHSILSLAGKTVSRNRLSILIYHQVFENADLMRPSEPIADQFRGHMQILANYFNPLSISNALQLLDQGRLPENSVCVTFDDGYANNLDVAAPILSDLKIPATIFIATDYATGTNMWNDRVLDLIGNESMNSFNCEQIGLGMQKVTTSATRVALGNRLLHQLKYLKPTERSAQVNGLVEGNTAREEPARMMTPNQIRQLSDAGFEIGAHTQSHPILSNLSVEKQREEILRSKQLLEEWTGKVVAGFAYPNGKANADYTLGSRNIVRELGFDYAVTTNWGISDPSTDVFQLNRFSPWAKNPVKFHAQLVRNMIKHPFEDPLKA